MKGCLYKASFLVRKTDSKGAGMAAVSIERSGITE